MILFLKWSKSIHKKSWNMINHRVLSWNQKKKYLLPLREDFSTEKDPRKTKLFSSRRNSFVLL